MPTTRSDVPAKSVRVLLVEDDPLVAKTERSILERAGFTVTLAETGPEGLRFAQTELPMAIVMDGDLPGMDGFEVCRLLMADAATMAIPVLFCSGSPDARERARLAGGKDFLEKPHEVVQLAECLNRLLAY